MAKMNKAPILKKVLYPILSKKKYPKRLPHIYAKEPTILIVLNGMLCLFAELAPMPSTRPKKQELCMAVRMVIGRRNQKF